VVGVRCLHVGDVAGVLGVGVLERLQLLRVLVGRVAEQLLDVVDALLHGRVLIRRVLDALGVLQVRVFQGLQLLGVLVRGVAKLPLQVRDAPQQRRVVGAQRVWRSRRTRGSRR